MIKQRKTSGSALVIISIIIVVIIIAGIGFVVWKNLTKEPATQNSITPETSQANTDSTSVKLKEGHVDTTFPSPLSWSYPETWTQTSTGNGPTNPDDVAQQSFTITSPSENYSVKYSVGVGGGIGGTCDTESKSTVQYIRKVPTGNFTKAQFVEYILDSYTIVNSTQEFSGYTYKSGILSNDPSIQQAKIGSSECVFGLGVVGLLDTNNYMLLGASIAIKSLDTKEGYVTPIKDISLIKEAFNSSEYKDAVNILLSTKYSG